MRQVISNADGLKNVTALPEPNPEFGHLASDEQVAAVVDALESRGFIAEVVPDGASATRRVLELLPPGAKVFTSLSETLTVTGLASEINKSGRYDAIRPKLAKLDRSTQRRQMKELAAAPEYVVGSVAAITEDGQIMVASGSGSQIGHYAYEADKVILVAGTQKIVPDADTALRRIEQYSYPLENRRMMDRFNIPTVLAKILTIRRDHPVGRTTLILVKEKIGF